MQRLALLLILLIYFGLFGQAQSLSKEQERKIKSIISEQVSGDVPGIAIGVVQNGKIIYEGYEGYANLQYMIPADENTRFNIASVAKQFTALCVLRLALEEKINLDDDIREYLPELYPKLEEPLKIKYLINHSSGIRDYYDLMSIQGEVWWRKESMDNNDALALIAKQESLNFKPNSDYLYSNSNYTILTKIVEKVTNTSFQEYAKTVFSDLGMDQTSFLEDYMYVIPNQALPYSNWGDGKWQQYPMITNLFGDGFLFTTLPDQLQYEKSLQNAARTNNTLLQTSQKPVADTKIQTYGYGLEFNKVLGYASINHSGGTGSYNAYMVRFPDQKLSIVAMSNNGNIWSGYIANRIAAEILEKKPTAEGPYYPAEAAKEIPKEELLGGYLSEEELIIRILEEPDGLYWREGNNNPWKLNRVGNALYEWEANTKIKVYFNQKENGVESFTVYYPGAKERIHRKLNTFKPDMDYYQEFVGDYESEEVEVKFSLQLNEKNQLLYISEDQNDKILLELLEKDFFALDDFKLKVSRGANQEIEGLLVNYSRVKNLDFRKE